MDTRRRSSGLRFSFTSSTSAELPLLKSIAVRKLSTCQAQNALEQGVIQMLQQQVANDVLTSSPSLLPASDPTESDTPLFAALSTWSFSGGAEAGPSTSPANKASQAGPSSSSSPAPAGASWWTPRRKSSIGVSGRDAHSRPPHARPTRAATSFNPVASSPSSSSSSPSDVHAAATALTGLSEDGFESALALSRQWRRGAFVAQGPRGSSAPLPPTHRSIPVVCRGSASWDEYEDDMWSPSSADTFEADDYDQDGIYECAQQMPTSRSSSIAESRRGSLFLSSLLPPDALARRLSGSLSLSVEGYDPTPEQSRGPSLCCSSLRGSSASSSCGLRFKPSLNPRGSAGSAFSLQLDAGDDEDDAEHVAAHGDDGGDVTRCTPSICPDALNSIADELAWISERAMSDSYPSSFTEAVADEDAAF